MEFFKRELSDYVTTLNPVDDYIKQAVTFLQQYTGMSKKQAVVTIKDIIKNKGPINPIVTYRGRKDNGDREDMTTTLTEYLKSSVLAKDIVVPSLTVYDNPNKKKSLHADFLSINIKKRNIYKAAAFEAYQNKDMDGFMKNNVLQSVKKIFNNSLSGAYASPSTILYNPSQHYTLTSITRTVASIGNGVTESVVAGNKCLYTPDAVMDYITAIIAVVNINTVASAMSEYKLTYPTVENVLDMLWHSSDRYWDDKDKKIIIRDYVEKLDKYQLAAVMYVNDLHHLRKLNDMVVRDFLGSLAAKVPSGCATPLKELSTGVEGVNNLVHHICMSELKGKKIKYDELVKDDPKLLSLLGSTANNVHTVLNKYHLLLKAFFATDILPIDIAGIKSCLRDVIVLSDTDSTCGSYDEWVNWYFGNTKYTPESVALSAAIMTINTQVMDHNIRVFSNNMNIDISSLDLLKMKNEYFWSMFITANTSKHYFANTQIQEGNVYAEPKLELKGVHFIASAVNQEIVNLAHKDMVKLLSAVEKGVKIDARRILTKVANLERALLEEINKGSISVFKLGKVREPGAYKVEDKNKTPYFNHILWNTVFADKYGDPGEPSYMTIKIPLITKTTNKLNEYLLSIDDEEIRNKLTTLLSDSGKTMLGTFNLPLAIVGNSGLPPEILSAIDRHRVVLDNMNVYYILLETIGLYRKPGLLFSETGY